MKGRVNTCVNKSQVQALESCPSSDVTPPAVLPNLVPPLMEIRSQLAYQMHTWIAKNWMKYSASHVATTALLCPKMASEAISEHFLKFPGGAMPPDPPSLACYKSWLRA